MQLKAYLVSSKQANKSHIVTDANGIIGNIFDIDIAKGNAQI